MEESLKRVYAYSNVDERIFSYDFTEDQIQAHAVTFHHDIFFVLSDEEISEYMTEIPQDNLKADFIWFIPSVSGMHQVLCTCNHFLEADNSMDKLAKLAVKHFKRTGHTLNPRGN